MDPGGQQSRSVQRALDGGGLGTVDPVAEPHELPERGTRPPVPAGGALVAGGRRVVLLRGDRIALRAQARQPLADFPQLRLQVRAGGDDRGLALRGAAVEDLGEAGGTRLADVAQRLGQRFGVGRGGDVSGQQRASVRRCGGALRCRSVRA